MAQDFLQAASNAAASNVSGPVDALAWLLRKAGVPVPDDAVGGSKWMEQKGLTRPVKPGLLNMAGETAGLLAPIAAAAKAPQIAKGLLQMGENAAAPRTLNPQTGAVVWHGSPHKFDKFDAKMIGSGEGGASRGPGTYLGDDIGVAKETVANAASIDRSKVNFDVNAYARKAADYVGPEASKLEAAIYAKEVEEIMQKNKKIDLESAWDDVLSNWDSYLGKYQLQGNIYKVELPDQNLPKLIDWDASLIDQPDFVKKALTDIDARKGGKPNDQLFGDEVYKMLGVDELRKRGIVGLRYTPFEKGSGQNNYVVFPGEETLLKILERNGQGL